MARIIQLTCGQLRGIIREETRRLTEGGVETCPYCSSEFLADEGDYSTPGRVECPECGGDFDAEHDDGYEDEMDDDEPDWGA